MGCVVYFCDCFPTWCTSAQMFDVILVARHAPAVRSGGRVARLGQMSRPIWQPLASGNMRELGNIRVAHDRVLIKCIY